MKKSFWTSILVALIEAAIGILLLINPTGLARFIIRAFGVLLIIPGIFGIIRYFSEKPEISAIDGGLFIGVLECLFGGFCAFNPQWFIDTFPVLTVLYGVGVLVMGVYKLQWCVDMIRFKAKYWYLVGISALLSAAFGIAILVDPFTATEALWMFIAITVIIDAVADIVVAIIGRKTLYKYLEDL